MADETLIVAEKPSVARDIARVVGAKTKADGAFTGGGYVVTWALGHLVALCDPDEIDPKYKRWNAADLPILPENIPTKVLPKTRAQFSVVKKWMKDGSVARIICATDSGREGELIFRLIYEQAGCKKPVSRLWISSMTDQAIREGMKNLKPSAAYDPLYQSARCRAEADWLVGMNASRAFTLRYGALLSVGRVQTPTLKLIVQRDREIEAFEPKPYWEIRADFGDYTGLWMDPETKELRALDEALAKRVKTEVTGKTGVIAEATRELKRTPPPLLYDLTSLQRDANRLMGLPAAKTLQLAQALYEQHKLLTYPRTDSRYLPRDMIGGAKRAMEALPETYQSFVKAALDKPKSFFRVFNDERVTDHHAIIPTGSKADLSRLSEPERKLFDMVARRLIAAYYPDYEYESAELITKVDAHSFKTSGSTPKVEGWRALYRDAPEEAEEPPVPDARPGETRKVQGVSVKQQRTKPPAPHTDASLLAMMEHAGKLIDDEELRERMKASGLGTPATRAAVIERLIDVGYVSRKGRTILSTDKGRSLILVAPEEIASPETTGRWEKALYDIAGQPDKEKMATLTARFMEGIRRYGAFLTEAAARAPEAHFEKETRGKGGGGKRGAEKPKSSKLGEKCPVCGQGEVTENSKAFGCSRWKEGCKFTVWRDALKKAGLPALDAAQMKTLLSGGRVKAGEAEYRMDKGVLKQAPPM
jgi:DNA topoisomerase-3